MKREISSAFLLITVIFASPAYAADAARGKMIEALNVASDEFDGRLQKIKDGKSTHADYMSQRKNYSAGLSESNELYVVVFVPTDKKIIGGGMEYRISKKDLKIVKIVGYE
ncbi:hypothetical protein ACI2IY_22150 [Lysobacter enzymogenes]|uniref:hypothetical protein n=1 Tax=Lysobacter enzymogenes TaxID=69 RepID=UPI00384ADE7C